MLMVSLYRNTRLHGFSAQKTPLVNFTSVRTWSQKTLKPNGITKESLLDSRGGKQVFCYTKTFRTALSPTQSPVQWIPRVRLSKVKLKTSPFCALLGVDADVPYILSPVCLVSVNRRVLPFLFRLRVGRCVSMQCEYFCSSKAIVL